jgi:hypothetical protein
MQIIRAHQVGYRRVYYVCEVGKFWNPEPETTKGLRRAGSEKFGGEVIERIIKGSSINDIGHAFM